VISHAVGAEHNDVITLDQLGAVDPFGRPGITKAPEINIGGTMHRQRVTTTYLDSARQVIVATDLYAEDDQLLKLRTTSDLFRSALDPAMMAAAFRCVWR
jgi:hypothetical protein